MLSTGSVKCFDELLDEALVIEVGLIHHHHLQLVVHLLELLHLVLPLDQCHEAGHHHQLDFDLEDVEILVVQLS